MSDDNLDDWGGGYVILGKELDLAEARNTGYLVILGATKTNGSPKPILETNAHRDYFTFVSTDIVTVIE